METAEIDRIIELGGLRSPEQSIAVHGHGPVFTNRYRVDETAAVALALTGAAAAQLWYLKTGQEQTVEIDVRSAAAVTASARFDRLGGQSLDGTPAATTNFFRCRDGGWIHLHGGLPHLHSGTLDLLGCDDDPESVAAAVATWDSFELEEELAARNMCGARTRSVQEWKDHPQGAIVTAAPAVEIIKLGDCDPIPLPPGPRPLSGIRVLEFARILAAPISGRTLAEHGADVLNVSSRKLPGLFRSEVTTGHGKRSCYLELDDSGERSIAMKLAASADVFTNGYRSGSLQRRGFDPYDLADKRPGIVYVSIACYGHEGPWVQRRGWEQLAQSTSGLALAQGLGNRPLKMPALAPGDKKIMTAPNDYITGYLAAYGAMQALAWRATVGGSWWVRVSLCQTAAWFERAGLADDPESAPGIGDPSDLLETTSTSMGRLISLAPAVRMSVTSPYWELPVAPRGSHRPEWRGA